MRCLEDIRIIYRKVHKEMQVPERVKQAATSVQNFAFFNL